MRLKVRSLWRAVKDDLRIEFVPQQLTSYGGLELFRRYFRKREDWQRIAPRAGRDAQRLRQRASGAAYL
jgi:hypothetical protein